MNIFGSYSRYSSYLDDTEEKRFSGRCTLRTQTTHFHLPNADAKLGYCMHQPESKTNENFL